MFLRTILRPLFGGHISVLGLRRGHGGFFDDLVSFIDGGFVDDLVDGGFVILMTWRQFWFYILPAS